jgi:hypothetical protein
MEVLTRWLEYHRTIFDACTTSGAAVFDNRTGAFFNLDLEISGGALYTLKVCIGDQFNV